MVVHLPLSGVIPPELGNLANLERLYLNQNQLSGSLPHGLGNLSHLQELFLSDNQLTGSIPNELGNLSSLLVLRLEHNALSGDVPSSLTNLTNLYDPGQWQDSGDGLDLDYNQLNVPADYPNPAVPLQVFLSQKDPDWHLRQSTFACADVTEIPQSECEALVVLYTNTDGANWSDHTNWLATTTPSNWYGVTVSDGHVTSLSLIANALEGTIPASFGNLVNLIDLRLNSNLLSGSIPPGLGNLSQLEYLDLGRNQLTGSIPAELGNLGSLWHLSLGFNQLSGSIPKELGQLANLRELWFELNQLSGEIPPELGNLKNLRIIQLGPNQLTGSIPPELGALSNLEELAFNSNQLTGAIPVELGNLTNLTRLQLFDNQLSGPIPENLGYLTHLTELSLSYNQLTGTIPASLGNLVNLLVLQLECNYLEGDIPASLTNLTNLLDPGQAAWGLNGLGLDFNLLTVPADYPNPLVDLHTFLTQKDPSWYLNQGLIVEVGSEGDEIISEDGTTSIVIPPDVVSETATFTYYPQANLPYDSGTLLYASNSFELTAEDALGTPLAVFDPPLIVTINYTDEDVVGIYEELLALYYWDTGSNAWVDAVSTCPGGAYTRDLAGNTFSLPVCHLSEFALLGNPLLRTYLPMLQVTR